MYSYFEDRRSLLDLLAHQEAKNMMTVSTVTERLVCALNMVLFEMPNESILPAYDAFQICPGSSFYCTLSSI